MNGDRRRWALVAVVLATALAGCAGVLGGPPGSEGATPTPEPTSQVETVEPDVETFSYPDGADADSINYTLLLGNHVRSLNAQGYAYTEVQVGEGQGRLHFVDDVTSDPDERVQRVNVSRNLLRANESWRNGTFETFRTENRSYRRDGDGNVTTERVDPSADFLDVHDVASGYGVGTGNYGTVVRAFDWEARATTTVLGTEAVRFEATELTDETVAANFTSDSRGTLVVSEAGEILRLRLDLNSADGGSIRTTYRIRELGDVAVEEPDWIGDAS